MICRNNWTHNDYDYSFVECGQVLLENEYEQFFVNYEDWVNDYYVIDKWKSLKKTI